MKNKKIALITGISGQDGSYLAELLLKKNYKVIGLIRKNSNVLIKNISHIQTRLKLIQGDLSDSVSLVGVLSQIEKLDEVYNLASQSSPVESFSQPIQTAEITGIGAERMMDVVFSFFPKSKFYQASSCEMYGWTKESPQNEATPFNPASPYAAAKLYAHNIAKIYRKSYDRFISCGILFNHESPRRSFEFITQKIAYAAACAKLGIKTSKRLNEKGEPIFLNRKVKIGNLDVKRDWGFAGDYVKAMWKMLQISKPDDFVIGTGEAHSVKELCEEAFGCAGLDWKDFVVVDHIFVRLTEPGSLVADPSKAYDVLNWKPRVKFKKLVKLLVDFNIVKLNEK